MTRMPGRRALLEMLRAEGVRYIFGNPGTSESAIMDTLEDYPDVKYVLTTQEGVAMGMADAYARATGRPSFVNLHIDSGLANGISLLNNAHQGGTPLVLTAANKDVRKLAEGRTDLAEMVRLFTKWTAEVTHAEQVPGVVRRAFNEARTPPTGPVFIAFAANALDDEADMEIVPSAEGYFRIGPDGRAVEKAARILADAAQPLMIVGDRVAQSGATAEAVRVAEILGARVYASSYSEMNFPTGHPQFMGRIQPGMPAAREVMSEADVALAIGTNVFSGFFYFSGRALGPDTSLVHIDSAYREVGKSEPTDVGIIADPKVALAELAEALESSMSGSAREAAKGRATSLADEKLAMKRAWEKRLKERWDQAPMSTERMMTEVARALPADTIITDDSITTRDSVHGAIEFSEPGSVFGERGGAIGWGMGAALGIKLAHPDRPVVAIVGDGSSMMTVQALWTAANENIPVVYVICNNRTYRILKLSMNTYQTQVRGQESPSSRYMGMDFPVPLNIAGIAEAIGVYGRKIEDPAEIGPAMRHALELGKPAVLDISIDGTV
ncbi:MAG: thiamine pyrophosphate-binding protein [Chloroflexi bacterium]|nr:thiamine pyrophosphate-binding protein [Chloroflexota bacterium]